MKEIVTRLKEQRDIELAKSILESAGYRVDELLSESKYKNGIRMTLNVEDSDASVSALRKISLDLDILMQDDNTLQLVIPSKEDWIDTINKRLENTTSQEFTLESKSLYEDEMTSKDVAKEIYDRLSKDLPCSDYDYEDGMFEINDVESVPEDEDDFLEFASKYGLEGEVDGTHYFLWLPGQEDNDVELRHRMGYISVFSNQRC